MPLGLAIKTFFALLFKDELPDHLLKELRLSRALPPLETPKEDPRKREAEGNARSVQMLAILQRDGRLVDFLREDIRNYTDAQVGAAVRSLHEGCRQSIDRYVRLEPVIGSQEGEAITIEEGFDPAEIKLIGNVVGKPPLKGTLRHQGWRASKVELPSLSENLNKLVVAPAEVEIG